MKITLTLKRRTIHIIAFTQERRDERPPTVDQPTLLDIQSATCAAYGIAMDDLIGPSRERCFVEPRHIAMYLARELTDLTLPAIGRGFGGRDHTTVLNALHRIRERLGQTDDLDALDVVREHLSHR